MSYTKLFSSLTQPLRRYASCQKPVVSGDGRVLVLVDSVLSVVR